MTPSSMEYIFTRIYFIPNVFQSNGLLRFNKKSFVYIRHFIRKIESGCFYHRAVTTFTTMRFQKEIKLGLIGIVAALLVGAGEFLIHYSASGYESDLPFGFLGFVDPGRMTVGHYLLVVGIPLYFVGYYHIYLVLKETAPKLALWLFIFGAISFIFGGIWVSSRAFIGHLYHIIVPGDTDMWLEVTSSYNLLIENLVNVLRITILIVSILFVYIILKFKTSYPRWMAFFNPILLLIIVFALFFLLPIVGNYLVPTAMNVAHLIMFSTSVLALSKFYKP